MSQFWEPGGRFQIGPGEIMKTWLHLFSSFFPSGSGARSPRPSVIGIHRRPSTKRLITQIRHLLLSPVIKIAAASRWRADSD